MSRFLPVLFGLTALLPAMVVCAQTVDALAPASLGEFDPWQENEDPTAPAGWVTLEDGYVGGETHIYGDRAVYSDRVPAEWMTEEVKWISEESESDEVFDELLEEIEQIDETPRIDWMGGFLGYRYREHSYDWIVGDGDQFGMFSLKTDHYTKAGQAGGVGVGIQIHFLGGPVQTDMPPRVFDFSVASQWRKRIGDFGYDLAASVMASSDFEGSAREGIRYPAHAVGFWRVDPCTDLVFGVDYLDRGDISLLPVGGVIYTPNPDWRLELVFPRPRITYRLCGKENECNSCETFPGESEPVSLSTCDEYRLFVGGRLGGGSWAVERVGPFDDLATYRDLQVCVGLESSDNEGNRSAVEIGYVFDRHLEFTSGLGDSGLNDTVIVRWVNAY